MCGKIIILFTIIFIKFKIVKMNIYLFIRIDYSIINAITIKSTKMLLNRKKSTNMQSIH